MDPALKKRMIGAAILVVLAIIFVPMLFTGRPSERTETVDLNLPKTPDRDFTTRTIPLDTAPKPAPQGDTLATVDTDKERANAPISSVPPTSISRERSPSTAVACAASERRRTRAVRLRTTSQVRRPASARAPTARPMAISRRCR